MKKILVFLVSVLCCVSMATASKKDVTKSIVVLSDLHVVAPDKAASMTQQPGERKMLKHSAEILQTTVDSILTLEPTMVLITGDLTDDADASSHEYVVSQLSRLNTAGIKVLVIPGNHDCGKEYSKEQFAMDYAPFGYGSSSLRDEKSLSYVCEPTQNLAIVAIDSNGKSRAAMKWATEKVKIATKQGKRVIVMMHHHLTPHFTSEDKLLATSVIDGSEAASTALLEAGAHLVLTGHTHIHDAATLKHHNDSIIDVCTGALGGYPHPYRIMSVNTKTGEVESTTQLVQQIASEPSLQQLSRKQLATSVEYLIESQGRKMWDKLSGKLSARFGGSSIVDRFLSIPLEWSVLQPIISQNLTKPLVDLYLVTSEGNEQYKNTDYIYSEIADGIINIVEQVVRPEYQEAFLEMIQPELNNRLLPVLNDILNDLNPTSTTPLNDIHFKAKL